MQLGDWQEWLIGIWWFLNFVYLLNGLVRIFIEEQKLYNVDKILLVVFFPVAIVSVFVIIIVSIIFLLGELFKRKGGWLSKECK